MLTADERAGTKEVTPIDAKLKARVQEKIMRCAEIDAAKIGVLVREGVVLLWGSVASAHERSLAGQLAAEAADRTAIINHIHVFRTSQC